MIALWLACARGPALDEGGAEAPAIPGDTVRFVVTGDAGLGNSAQWRVARAMRRLCRERDDARGPGCDFLVLLGDNAYPKGVEGPDDPLWESRALGPFRQLELPVYAILGNHDYGNPPLDRRRAAAALGGPAEEGAWILPGPWYAFDAGPARIVALDTTAVMLGWTARQQRAFLAEQAAVAAGRPLVVLAHHPFRSNGAHGNAGAYEGRRVLPYASGGRVRRLYEEGLCGRAALLLSGHDHNRQWLAPHCGVELVVLGAGAAATGLVDRGVPTLFQEGSERGFGWFQLTAAGYRGEIHDEYGELDFAREGAFHE